MNTKELCYLCCWSYISTKIWKFRQVFDSSTSKMVEEFKLISFSPCDHIVPYNLISIRIVRGEKILLRTNVGSNIMLCYLSKKHHVMLRLTVLRILYSLLKLKENNNGNKKKCHFLLRFDSKTFFFFFLRKFSSFEKVVKFNF